MGAIIISKQKEKTQYEKQCNEMNVKPEVQHEAGNPLRVAKELARRSPWRVNVRCVEFHLFFNTVRTSFFGFCGLEATQFYKNF